LDSTNPDFILKEVKAVQHMRMTEKEKLYIQDQIKSEQLCAKKAQLYHDQTRDPSIQGLLRQCVDKSQRHADTLQGLLREAGISIPMTH
jgi:hypothetical protein